MPTNQYEQFDFSVGELSPGFLARAGLLVRAKSLKTARNVVVDVDGTLSQRPGSQLAGVLVSDGQIVTAVIAGSSYKLVFTSGKVDIWNQATRSVVTTLFSQPWNSTTATEMVVAPQCSKVFVFHKTFAPVQIERSSAGTWTATTFAFTSGIGAAKAQPYYRFADPGVTLTPSGTTGSITLTSSSAYFSASHVGLRLRLQGREVAVTGYTDTTHVTATVVQTLFPTVTLPVTSSLGFEIGEVIQGQDSTAKGEVVGVPGGTSLTLLMQTFTAFGSSEKVVGRNAVTTTTSSQSGTTDAAVLDWTEQAMSDLRGWPATGAVHAGRLWMSGFDLIPFGIVASAVNAFTDCEVGTNDSDAIFEELSNESTGLIRHIVSAEQLLVLTSRKAFYYPESEANPIKPSGFDLLQIGPDGASACRPALISEGVVFASSGGGSVMGAFPTGDVRRSWRTADMSRMAAHLVNTPRCMTYVTGPRDPTAEADERRIQRFVYTVNSDGRMSVLAYNDTDSEAVPGWFGWDTEGEFRWADADEGECWVISTREYDGGTAYHLEIIDYAYLLDSALPVTDYRGAATNEVIETIDGVIAADKVYRCPYYPNATLAVVIGDTYIGMVETDADGDFGVPDMAGTITVGFKFEVECVPWTPMPAEDQRARRRKRRMAGILVRYQGKGLAVDGVLRPLYEALDDQTAPAPLRDEWWRAVGFGWSHEPTCTIARAFPAPWKLLGLALEVAG